MRYKALRASKTLRVAVYCINETDILNAVSVIVRFVVSAV